MVRYKTVGQRLYFFAQIILEPGKEKIIVVLKAKKLFLTNSFVKNVVNTLRFKFIRHIEKNCTVEDMNFFVNTKDLRGSEKKPKDQVPITFEVFF